MSGSSGRGVKLGTDAQMDTMLYGRKEEYEQSIATTSMDADEDDNDIDEDAEMMESRTDRPRWGHQIKEQSRTEDMNHQQSSEMDSILENEHNRRIISRMNDYQKQAFERSTDVTMAQKDVFSAVLDQSFSSSASSSLSSSRISGDNSGKSYREIMKDTLLNKEQSQLLRIDMRQRQGQDVSADLQRLQNSQSIASKFAQSSSKSDSIPSKSNKSESKVRSRWDATPAGPNGSMASGSTPKVDQQWSSTPAVMASTTPGLGFGGGSTPGLGGGATPHRGSRTPGLGWSETPAAMALAAASGRTPGVFGATPSSGVTPFGVTPGMQTPHKRWAATPDPRAAAAAAATAAGSGVTPGLTPSIGGATPSAHFGATPVAFAGPVSTPAMPGIGPRSLGSLAAAPTTYRELRDLVDFESRNRPWTEEMLDAEFAGIGAGYQVIEPPASYVPTVSWSRSISNEQLSATVQAALGKEGGFTMEEDGTSLADIGLYEVKSDPTLPAVKHEDYKFFADLIEKDDEQVKDPLELKRRMILKLILKVKNGSPPQRKVGLRQLTERALWFGAQSLFETILPLLMSSTLDDLERHLLVKVVDRILYKLGDKVGPYVHNVLVVIEPLLIDEDYYARVEGREIIANLSKAAGLPKMISVMRPHIDDTNEYVRNVTARAFSVVASALGIPVLIPFLKAVAQSKRSWEARHTGIKIIQQIAILMGCAVLPHLVELVDIIKDGLDDEQPSVRTMTALSLAALAEASHPYGFEAFYNVLKPLVQGVKNLHGKSRATYLKAFGFIVPLSDPEYATVLVNGTMPTLIEEFDNPEEEIRKIVLKVLKQWIGTEGVEPGYLIDNVLGSFFSSFWNRRVAMDRSNYKSLIETTVAFARKCGGSVIISQIVSGLVDDNESYRKMVIETIDKIVTEMGSVDISEKLEESLFDGILYSFQELSSDDNYAVLNGFGSVTQSLGVRCKPYLPQILINIKQRLQHPSMKVRQTAADLITRVSSVVAICKQEILLKQIGVLLFELLGEEYPDVLGSMLSALKSVVSVQGMDNMIEPPIKDIILRLTPILKNRNEKVQEHCIDLIGRIAEYGSECVSPKEWMRIAYELLDMLRAPKKNIRRCAINTFGYISKAVGPQDIIEILLNNLRVQQRQNRVCTTIAIAVVAETCGPFTVLPALMNEYRVPELNVRTGVLKSLSFMFEYLGNESSRHYIYPVTELLEDALVDRDIVHRQMACSVVKHLSLGVYGLGCEDALQHLLNFIWPNLFENTPHLIQTFTEAIDALRVSLGCGILLLYILQGLFHPARKVRKIYWRLYNLLYVGSQHSLVIYYPIFTERLPIDTLDYGTLPTNNDYTRHEMLYFL